MNVLTIAGRELRAIFNTTIGWLVLAGFLLVTGVFWASMVSYYAIESTDMVASPYSPSQMNLTDYLFSPFFGNTAVVLMMVCPAISMRLFSEERKDHTLELLLTSPVSTWEIVVGKFLGALGFIAILLVATLAGPILVSIWGDPDLATVASGYFALMLVASGIVAMGMLFSAFTSNQIVALVWTFAAALGLWVLSWVSQDPTSVFSEIALVSHVEEMLSGLIHVSDLVYFASFTGFFLFATWQKVESFRWS